MNWYIVQAYSGFEKKVVESIKEELNKNKLSDSLQEILVPTHQVTEVKKGKRTKREKKFFPGYVLIKIELTKQIYHLIKNLQKVSGFLGSSDRPTPISDNEIKRILTNLVDMSPRGIREHLKLNNPIYEVTSAYGHFGRKPTNKGEFSWEKTDLIDLLTKHL